MKYVKYSGWRLVIIQFLLIALILYSSIYEYAYLKRESSAAIYILSLLIIAISITGLIITILTFRQRITPHPYPRENAKFIKSGIYSVVRHPMYLFITLLLVGFSLILNAYGSLVLNLFLFLFFDYKTRKEELYMREKFPEYAEYQKKTKKLIPYIY
ncbi:MAG: methyltransferase family protein [Ignavibacteria bacterium]